MNLGTYHIIAPLVGGVIGYITNAIAIRMLFRPHEEKRFFGRRIPFTPGIIPKGKDRIAKAVGDVIGENLMNRDVLERFLLSDDTTGKVRAMVEDFLDRQRTNGETVREFLLHHGLSREDVDTIAASVKEDIGRQLGDRLADTSVGDRVARAVVDHIMEPIMKNGAQDIIQEFGGLVALIGNTAGDLIGRFFAMVREPCERHLAKHINGMLREHGKDIVTDMIGNETDAFLDKRVKDLLQGREEQSANVAGAVERLYRTVIEKHLGRILQTVDISRIVSDRITEMDIDEMEGAILKVVSKELKAIVWFGALLGLVIGCLGLAFH